MGGGGGGLFRVVDVVGAFALMVQVGVNLCVAQPLLLGVTNSNEPSTSTYCKLFGTIAETIKRAPPISKLLHLFTKE